MCQSKEHNYIKGSLMTRQERAKRSAYLETIRSTGTISERCDTENGKNV